MAVPKRKTSPSKRNMKLEQRLVALMLLVTKLAPVKALIRWTCGKEAGGIFLEPAAL